MCNINVYKIQRKLDRTLGQGLSNKGWELLLSFSEFTLYHVIYPRLTARVLTSAPISKYPMAPHGKTTVSYPFPVHLYIPKASKIHQNVGSVKF